MGGALPLGYTVADKKLVPVPEEAETVRRIMRQYLDAANVPELRGSLIRAGVTSKRVVSRKGNVRGGGPFSRGALHHLLSNRTYIGEVVHNGKVYPGEHEAIVDRNLFEAVQAKLADRTNVPLARSGRRNVSLLAGMIRDEHGRPMSPAHTRNHGRRYRVLPTVPMMTATLPPPAGRRTRRRGEGSTQTSASGSASGASAWRASPACPAASARERIGLPGGRARCVKRDRDPDDLSPVPAQGRDQPARC